jgi:NADH dehydrogenase FAD-containing subunit
LEEGSAVVADSEPVRFDFFINATGLQPPRILKQLDLPLADDGALSVDAHLRSPADPAIHGGGDCVAVEGHALPRIGVYAIRQAPILFHNLLASLDGTAPRRFTPQKHYLWIMNLGDGTGLAARSGMWWRGRSAFLLKDWIDRRFLRSFQEG